MKKAKEKKLTKTTTMTIRIELPKKIYLEKLAEIVRNQTGIQTVNKSWVMSQLMQLGLPSFEHRYAIKHKKAS